MSKYIKVLIYSKIIGFISIPLYGRIINPIFPFVLYMNIFVIPIIFGVLGFFFFKNKEDFKNRFKEGFIFLIIALMGMLSGGLLFYSIFFIYMFIYYHW